MSALRKAMALRPSEVQRGDLVERPTSRGVWQRVTDVARHDSGAVVLYLAARPAERVTFNAGRVWRTNVSDEISVLREVDDA